MSDLISRAKLMNKLADAWTLDAVYAIIQDMPTEESEIRRCKDCFWWDVDSEGETYCRDCGCRIGDAEGNGFCSDSKRKEGRRCRL